MFYRLIPLSLALLSLVFLHTPLIAVGEVESAEDLLFMEIPSVITASRSEKSVAKAPSVVTVWNEEDIQKMGLRSVEELLERTAGFFPSFQYAAPVIGSRGIIADGNEAFLLLIDGHSMNSIAMKGAQHNHIFPLLSKVKRVEIVRGPGSTLWGSDAALGIVHIITKDGEDVNGLKTTVDYESGRDQVSVNALFGKSFGYDQNLLLSFTQMQSYGSHYRTVFGWQNPGQEAYVGGALGIEDSWEFFAKFKQKGFTLSALAESLTNMEGWSYSTRDAGMYNRRKHMWMDAKYDAKINDAVSAETRIFSDLILTWDHIQNPLLNSDRATAPLGQETDMNREQNIGFDSMLTLLVKNHELKTGVRFVRTELEPGYSVGNVPDPNNLKPGDAINVIYSPNYAPREHDISLGVFIEDDWKILDNLDLIAGVRGDYNNLRENLTKFLPRASLIWGMNDEVTAKYMFNTGYIRPPASMSYLGKMSYSAVTDPAQIAQYGTNYYYNIPADKSENIVSHDLQLQYHRPTSEASITLYQTRLDNFFNYVGGNPYLYNGTYYRIKTANTNSITSNGIELDGRVKVAGRSFAYGGFSTILESKVDRFETTIQNQNITLQGGNLFNNDKTMLSYPKYIWNLGINVSVQNDVTIDLHYRGWTDMWTHYSSGYARMGPEHFVDVNILCKNVFHVKALDVSLYSKNFLNNNTSRVAMPALGGYYTDEDGRTIGFKVSYKL